MRQYLDIIKNILENGTEKQNRTGTSTLMLPFLTFRHNMQEGFPVLTVRKFPYKSTFAEMYCFIQGFTSKKAFQDEGCKFWDNWANPTKIPKGEWRIGPEINSSGKVWHEFSREETHWLQKEEDDLGPIGYSYQMRRFDQVYDENDEGTIKTYDQLADVIHTLKTNGNDRRMVIILFNPKQLHLMALPPCTTQLSFVVSHGDVLNMGVVLRSSDAVCGLGSDIAGNALLMTLIAKECGYKLGDLFFTLDDCHIYQNQVNAAKELLTRIPQKLPTLRILNSSGSGDSQFDIFKWYHKEIELVGYNPLPPIDLGPIAV